MKIALGSAKGLAYLHEDCMYLLKMENNLYELLSI